jgi:hypothetical protein
MFPAIRWTGAFHRKAPKIAKVQSASAFHRRDRGAREFWAVTKRQAGSLSYIAFRSVERYPELVLHSLVRRSVLFNKLADRLGRHGAGLAGHFPPGFEQGKGGNGIDVKPLRQRG